MRCIGIGLIVVAGTGAFGGPGPALADSISLDDVLRLHAAGVSDDIIVSEVIVTGSVFVLWPDDIVRLKEAGLSNNLIEVLVETSRDDFSPSDLYFETSDEVEVEQYEDEEVDSDDYSTTHFYVGLNYGYSGWWYNHAYWDYWYCDWWYAPYQFSFCWNYGGGYPWYGGYGCGPSSYNCSPYAGCGFYSYPAGVNYAGLSTEKWKSSGGTQRSNLDRHIARSDLATRDLTGDKVKVSRSADSKSPARSSQVAKVDSRADGKHVRTVKAARSPRLATKAKASVDGKKVVPTRKSTYAKVGTPNRASKSQRAPAKSIVPSVRRGSKSTVASSNRLHSGAVRSSAVRSSKPGPGRSPSAVRSAPARSVAPSRASAPSVRSAPTRSAPTRSAPAMRSGSATAFGGSRGRGR